MTTPVWLVGAVEAQAVTPLGPASVQVTLPVGAADPTVPVMRTVKVRVELSAPPPVALRTIPGATFAMMTFVDETAATLV